MDIEQLRNYCLGKGQVTEGLPFDEETLVMKVGGKMFALFNIEHFESVNLKCDPDRAVELRSQYNDILPGYHMNKKHWNTVMINRGVPDQLIYKLVDLSYDLVYKGLPKRLREFPDKP